MANKGECKMKKKVLYSVIAIATIIALFGAYVAVQNTLQKPTIQEEQRTEEELREMKEVEEKVKRDMLIEEYMGKMSYYFETVSVNMLGIGHYIDYTDSITPEDLKKIKDLYEETEKIIKQAEEIEAPKEMSKFKMYSDMSFQETLKALEITVDVIEGKGTTEERIDYIKQAQKHLKNHQIYMNKATAEFGRIQNTR